MATPITYAEFTECCLHGGYEMPEQGSRAEEVLFHIANECGRVYQDFPRHQASHVNTLRGLWY